MAELPGPSDPRTHPVAVPMLMYHSIAAESSPRFRPYAVTPEAFDAHMAALDQAGYTALSVGAFVALADQPKEAWPERPVVLTFDDAFLDFQVCALPILADHGFPATLYVPTAYVGRTSLWLEREGEANRPMMSWQGLDEVVTSGIEIGSHSQSHPQLDLTPPDRAAAEIGDSRQILEQRLQVPVTTFAYPFGYWSRPVRTLVRDAGYVSACAVRDLAASSLDDRFTLSRWTVPFGMGSAELLSVLATQTGRRAKLRSNGRAHASRLLRRAGLKRRGEMHEASAGRDGESDDDGR